MELRVITGRAGTGKSHLILQELAEKSKAEPLGSTLLLLVPEQATFNAEWSLLNNFGISGSLRVKICDFRKLFDILAKEQNIKLEPWLNELGKSMILRKIVNNNRQNFTVFGKSARHKGFVDNLLLMMDELTKFQITSQQLNAAEKQISELADNQMTGEKLADISMVYDEYCNKLKKDYCDETKLMRILAEAIGKSRILSETEIYLDGFTDFDPGQIEVLKELIKKCPKVTLALIMDNKQNYEEDDVFAFPERTFNWLRDFAENENIIFEHKHLTENKRFGKNKDMLSLEKAFAKKSFIKADSVSAKNIQVVRSADSQKQLEFAALEILKSVKNNGYRMSDFAIVSRRLADCHRQIEKTLDSYGIPYFADNAKNMYHHPLVETILAMVETESEKWQSSAVLRYMKAGMTNIPLEDLDILENYALANGIKGTYWQKAGSWQRYYQNNVNLINSQKEDVAADAAEKLAKINEIGKKAVKPLMKFHYDMRDLPKQNNKYLLSDVIETIIKNLEYLQAEKILEEWIQKTENSGLAEQASFHKQIFSEVISLLDQLQTFLGDTYVTLAEVYTLLAEGADKMELYSIPPSADEVLICDISRTRMPNVKVAFIIDCNEGIFPAKVQEDGLLNSSERDDLRKIGLNLAVSKRQLQFAEDYHIYMALTRASEKLYLCYSEFDFTLNPLQPSVILDNAAAVLPDLYIQKADNNLDTNEVFNNTAFFNEMERQINLAKNGTQIDNVWWQIMKYYRKTKNHSAEINAMQSGLDYQKDCGILPKPVVESLYGSLDKTSVSRIEVYNKCPCMYYGRYGLKLEPRQEFKVRSQDVGQIYHDVLAYVLEQLLKEEADFSNLSVEYVVHLVQEAIAKCTDNGIDTLLNDTEKNSYLQYKITAVVTNSIMDIAKQMAAGDFRPVGFEVSFGANSEISGLTIELSQSKKITVRGFIDRIDMAESETGEYYRIIDYKSSGKNLDLNDIYYGLNWQMPIYLEAVLNSRRNDSSKPIKPAGMFYFPVKETFNSVENPRNQVKKIQKLQGLIVLDNEAIRLAENDFFENSSAETMDLKLKKNGDFGKNARTINGLEYDIILAYIKKHLTENLSNITNGDIRQNPVLNKNKYSCEYCDFRKICILDNCLRLDYYRITNHKPEEIIEIMRSDVGWDK